MSVNGKRVHVVIKVRPLAEGFLLAGINPSRGSASAGPSPC